MSDIQPVIQVLSQPTLYGTGAVLSMQRGIITSEIGYSTVNEEYVIQKLTCIIHEEYAKMSVLPN
jgi:hypothetical protein